MTQEEYEKRFDEFVRSYYGKGVGELSDEEYLEATTKFRTPADKEDFADLALGLNPRFHGSIGNNVKGVANLAQFFGTIPGLIGQGVIDLVDVAQGDEQYQENKLPWYARYGAALIPGVTSGMLRAVPRLVSKSLGKVPIPSNPSRVATEFVGSRPIDPVTERVYRNIPGFGRDGEAEALYLKAKGAKDVGGELGSSTTRKSSNVNTRQSTTKGKNSNVSGTESATESASKNVGSVDTRTNTNTTTAGEGTVVSENKATSSRSSKILREDDRTMDVETNGKVMTIDKETGDIVNERISTGTSKSVGKGKSNSMNEGSTATETKGSATNKQLSESDSRSVSKSETGSETNASSKGSSRTSSEGSRSGEFSSKGGTESSGSTTVEKTQSKAMDEWNNFVAKDPKRAYKAVLASEAVNNGRNDKFVRGGILRLASIPTTKYVAESKMKQDGILRRSDNANDEGYELPKRYRIENANPAVQGLYNDLMVARGDPDKQREAIAKYRLNENDELDNDYKQKLLDVVNSNMLDSLYKSGAIKDTLRLSTFKDIGKRTRGNKK